eukprot:TRINITY_DN1283_c0_g1_i1.p1 TRINITY_DN1283_c0_g1~~TRINITY_DN1283_c0_g1_i1.p1  ORF type:complete len:155 (-),score=7.72 TRINITY_DN1283_c0_g1_i1:20-484(-)
MLLKQRQQLHDNAAKFLTKRWSEETNYKKNKQELDDSDDDDDDDYVGLKPSDSYNFSQFRSNILARHKDLALKDDTLRRMGSFYQAAPQANNNQNKAKRLKIITSFYKNIRPKAQDKHRIATLSPNFRKSTAPSIFQRIRQSMAVGARKSVMPE